MVMMVLCGSHGIQNIAFLVRPTQYNLNNVDWVIKQQIKSNFSVSESHSHIIGTGAQ